MKKDSRPPYHRRQTKPIPRVALAPVATTEPCPLCNGSGHVTRDEALEYRRTRETEPPPPPNPEAAA